MLPYLPQTGTYNEVTLCFLDILGYKNALRTLSANSPDRLLRLAQAAYFFGKGTLSAGPPHVERRIISDSIVLWTNDSIDGLVTILEICKGFQDYCLWEGFLTRGAIVRGKHYALSVPMLDPAKNAITNSSDEVIISPALAQAYEMERNLSLPLIHISSELGLSLARLTESSLCTTDYHLTKTHDGHLFDGYFSDGNLVVVSKQYPVRPNQRDRDQMAQQALPQATLMLETIRKRIVKGLEEDCGRIQSKWKYVLQRYNTFVDIAGKASGLPQSLKVSVSQNPGSPVR